MSVAFITSLMPNLAFTTCKSYPSQLSKSTYKTSYQPINMSMKKSSNNNNKNNNNDHTYSRFQEFIPSDQGDQRIQDELVEQVLQQSTILSTTEIIESKIEKKMNALSEHLDDLYLQFERDTQYKNEQLTLRTSLPTLSKWNKQLLHSGKTSKILCDEIVQELEDVNNLLRRIDRRQNKGRRKKTKYTDNVKGEDHPQTSSTNTSSMNQTHQKQFLQVCLMLLVNISACTIAIDALKKITTTQSNYSYDFQQTIHSALISGIIIFSTTYISMLHNDVKQSLRNDEEKQPQKPFAHEESNLER